MWREMHKKPIGPGFIRAKKSLDFFKTDRAGLFKKSPGRAFSKNEVHLRSERRTGSGRVLSGLF